MKTSVCSAGGGGCGGEPPCIPGTGKEMTCKNRRRPPIGLQIINAPDASMAGGGVLTPSVNSVPVVSMSSRQGGFGVNQKQMEIRGPLRKKAPSVFPKAHLPVSTICTPHPCPGHHSRLLAPSVRKGTRLPTPHLKAEGTPGGHGTPCRETLFRSPCPELSPWELLISACGTSPEVFHLNYTET